MPEIKAVPLTETNWGEIAGALQAGDATQIRTFEPLSDGYFTAAVVRPAGEWQRLSIVVFPYADPAWQRRASDVLQFEARCWQRWCLLQEALSADGDETCPPLWWSRTEPRQAAAHDVPVTLDDDTKLTLPALVRPYLPFPSLAEQPLSPAILATAIDGFRPIAEWVIGDEELSALLARRAQTAPQPQPATRWWNRLWPWPQRPNPFVWPELVAESDARVEDTIRPHHLLWSGRVLMPTRWRAYHAGYAAFGRLDS